MRHELKTSGALLALPDLQQNFVSVQLPDPGG